MLGYIAVLEVQRPGSVGSKISWRARNFPRRQFRTLKLHATVDVEHARDLDALLDRLPLQQVHHDLLRESAFLTIDALSRDLEDVIRRHERPKRPSATLTG